MPLELLGKIVNAFSLHCLISVAFSYFHLRKKIPSDQILHQNPVLPSCYVCSLLTYLLTSWSSFQTTVGTNYAITIDTRSDWLKNLAPFCFNQ